MGSLINPVDDIYKYDPDKHIPDLSSKVIIVTGGNNGIGKATVVELAKHNPRRIYLAARSRAKYDEAMHAVRQAAPSARVDFLELDLASFASIKRAADRVLGENDRLDILINNAGVMGLPPAQTEQGYEIHFGTNHVGHALLTKLLLPLLLQTTTAAATATPADVRIVNVSSGARSLAPKGTFWPEQVTTAMPSVHSYVRYGLSKQANVLHARELARRHPRILSTSIEPGRVATPLLDAFFATRSWTNYFQRAYDLFARPLTPAQGAFTQLWAATWDSSAVVPGAHYLPWGKPAPGDTQTRDLDLAAQLWDWQEAEFKKHGYT